MVFGPADVAELVSLLDSGAAPAFAVGTGTAAPSRAAPGAVVRPSRCARGLPLPPLPLLTMMKR